MRHTHYIVDGQRETVARCPVCPEARAFTGPDDVAQARAWGTEHAATGC